jgi:hypothetical protein
MVNKNDYKNNGPDRPIIRRPDTRPATNLRRRFPRQTRDPSPAKGQNKYLTDVNDQKSID